MKLQDIEALLSLPHKIEMEIKEVPETDILDLARYYGSHVKKTMFCKQTSIKRNDVEIILVSPLDLSTPF